jgi:hypothetical protein
MMRCVPSHRLIVVWSAEPKTRRVQ